MQEIDELRANSMAMASAPQNPKPDQSDEPKLHPKVREEGELTSSDDDALHANSDAPSTSLSAPPSSITPSVSVKTYVQGSNPGKLISASLPTRAADKNPQPPGSSKGFDKNKGLLKSSNPGWPAHTGNSNLVIRFSDDEDSGSDEERRRKLAQANNINQPVANSSKKPPAFPYVKPGNARRAAKNEGKVVMKKVALNHTFISSMPKIHGSNVRSTGLLGKRRTWSKKSNVIGRNLPSQDTGFSKHVDLSSSKLRDLRLQIAMRENELKLKKVQINKENVSESCKDVNIMTENKLLQKKSRTLTDDLETDAEEPDRKRLKLAQNIGGQLSLSDLQDKSVVHAHDGNISSHANDETKVSQRALLLQPIQMQTQDGEQLPRLSHNDNSGLVQDAPGVAVSCSLSDCVFKPMEALPMRKQAAPLTDATFAGHQDKPHVNLLNNNKLSSSVPNHDTYVDNTSKVNDHRPAVSLLGKLKSKFDGSLLPRSLQVSESKFESPNASPDNTSTLHSLGKPTVSRYDVDSLFEVEELHDKELEEAQEHRRRCEIEEINALKAYRRAQRALDEANARCTYLYRKRELYSSKLRSFLMDDSSLALTSRQHGQNGDVWNMSYNVAAANLDLIPRSRHQLQAECEPGNQVGYDSNAPSADGDALNRMFGNEGGHHLGSEACSEPDASTSELLVHVNRTTANGVPSPSNDPNFSPDYGDDTFPLDHISYHDTVTWPKKDNFKEHEKDTNVDSARIGISQDPLLLEAYLRSKLFSRLGVTDSSRKVGVDYESNSTVRRLVEENVPGGKTQRVEDNIPLVDLDPGIGEPESGIAKTKFNGENQQPVEEHSLNDLCTLAVESEDTVLHSNDITSASIMRSAMKAACSFKLNDAQIIKQHANALIAAQSEDKSSLENANYPEEIVKSLSFGRMGSYTFEAVIDPFRPLCMYELRGRCNNGECPWQHLRDNTLNNANMHNSSDGSDCQPGSSFNCQKLEGCKESFGVLTPPKYVVYFNSLKSESHAQGSMLAYHIRTSQKSTFSNSLAVSNSLMKQLPSDEPYLHGNDGCVGSYVSSGHSLYFQSRNGVGNSLRNGLVDNDQALEVALFVLNQEINRLDGMKKALSILSRALEADPSSSQLWIVYLLLYYLTRNTVGELSKKSSCMEDDLFSHAVKHNTQSYELWLLYINSRRQLNDRLAAYEKALSCLCRYASTKDGFAVHDSAVILDLFLQMLHCYCISGNIVKAVQRIQGLILADRNSNESHSLLLSDILRCLTISDKCIFWVCCVYLVIYRKLPDPLVQQFEFEKDISVIEWPYFHLSLEEKQQVFKLMEIAMNSVRLCADGESCASDNIKSFYLIALNHVKLVEAIGDGVNGKMLLEKYRNSCPSCLQIILLAARAHGIDDENRKFEGFEKALCNWPKDVAGIQSIWNQFAEYVLRNGRPDRAKLIMDRWFHSVWKPLFCDGSVDFEDPLLGLNLNALPSNSNRMDTVFGLLNLSLFNLLQNNVVAAHLVIDKALRTADGEVLRHCARDHAAFLFNNGSQLKKDTSLRGLLDILKGYMIHGQLIPAPDHLTTKFVQDIKKPRLRQLVSNILCPISPNSFLVNSVLEIWFGPSLLPKKTDKLKDLVNFVESILDFSPGNYRVAISACNLICENPDDLKSKSPSVLFWASSLLVNTIYQAMPVPPEFVWVEAAELLGNLSDKQEIYESFHRRALAVHPFSIKLWKSYLNLSTAPSKRSYVIEAVRDKGLEIDCDWTS